MCHAVLPIVRALRVLDCKVLCVEVERAVRGGASRASSIDLGSGIVAARLLKRAGHRPEVFEAGAEFGGVWADAPTNAVVYKGLQTNLPTAVMQSPDLDFAPGLPSYVSKPQLGASDQANCLFRLGFGGLAFEGRESNRGSLLFG